MEKKTSTKRGRYSTRQQSFVLTFMKNHKGESLTVDEIHSSLIEQGFHVGKTTVYRAIERLAADGVCVQVPDITGGSSRYCCLDTSTPGTCLACLSCHRVYFLMCGGLDEFMHHVWDDHGFEVLPERTVVYGYCKHCRRSSLDSCPLSAIHQNPPR